jgi:hypothetical protein
MDDYKRMEERSELFKTIEVLDEVVEQGCAERGATTPKGLKYDSEKEPLGLLSRTWLLGVARVMGFGAKKYAAHNWRGGIERSRLVSAALRHILAYNEGEDTDPETGLSHLAHASCCLMFAYETHETHPELDDRYKRREARATTPENSK